MVCRKSATFALLLCPFILFFFYFTNSQLIAYTDCLQGYAVSPHDNTTCCVNVPLRPAVVGNEIPRILHFLWPNQNWSYGDRDPDGIAQRLTLDNIGTIQSSNPEWQVKIWTNEDCYAIMKDHFSSIYLAWSKLTPRLKMWDAVRPAILFVYGGIYLDHDIECDVGVHFSDWIAPTTRLLLRAPIHESKKLGNHFMGSCPGHSLWMLYLNNIIKEIPLDYDVIRHTGPNQLYPTFQEYIIGVSKNEQTTIRLLGKHELDSTG